MGWESEANPSFGAFFSLQKKVGGPICFTPLPPTSIIYLYMLKKVATYIYIGIYYIIYPYIYVSARS